MSYSQGDGVNTSLSRFLYCTHVFCVGGTGVPFLYVYGYLPWHGHGLPRTLIIKIMCVNHLHLLG